MFLTTERRSVMTPSTSPFLSFSEVYAAEVGGSDGEGAACPLYVAFQKLIEHLEPLYIGDYAGGHQLALLGEGLGVHHFVHTAYLVGEIGGVGSIEIWTIVFEKRKVTVEAGGDELGNGGQFFLPTGEFLFWTISHWGTILYGYQYGL